MTFSDVVAPKGAVFLVTSRRPTFRSQNGGDLDFFSRGPIRNRKTVEKIIHNRKTEKKIRSKPKTASKTVKTDTFSHPSY